MKDPARYNTKKIEKILQRDLSDKRYVMRCYGYLYRLDRENSITYLPDIIRICKNQPDRVFVALYNLDDKDMKDRIVKKIDETDFTKQFDKEELDTFNTAIEKLKNKK